MYEYDLFRSIAHDLKTPLAIISSEVQNVIDLLDYDKNEHEIRTSLASAQFEAMKMAHIVDKVIKDVYITEFQKEMIPISVCELIEDVAGSNINLFKLNGNNLNIKVSGSPPKVLGNYDSLALVISNLLSNANRFTENGNITISVCADGFVVTIIVSDTGRGIREDLLPHIFQRGVSADGTGLGLFICKTAIDMHNGDIWAESEFGKGFKVFIRLPVFGE